MCSRRVKWKAKECFRTNLVANQRWYVNFLKPLEKVSGAALTADGSLSQSGWVLAILSASVDSNLSHRVRMAVVKHDILISVGAPVGEHQGTPSAYAVDEVTSPQSVPIPGLDAPCTSKLNVF